MVASTTGSIQLLQTAAKQARTLLSPWKPLVLPRATKFWEPDKKSGYGSKKRPPVLKSIQDGVKLLGPEVKKYGQEMKEKFRCDSLYFQEPGDYETVWKFDNKETIDSFIITSDMDHREGKSEAHFVLGKNKTGIFHGTLNTEPPKDGIIKHSGYCNIRSPACLKSFKREMSYDWSHYTHMLVRCRGDGRPYQLIIAMNRYFDLQWNDQYNYPLFTRGGPYWQLAKIPFSKFILSHKGRIQDKQRSVVDQLKRISYFGITLGDGVSGPFQLEIDYVALIYDPSHTEHFHYEMYKVNPAVHD